MSQTANRAENGSPGWVARVSSSSSRAVGDVLVLVTYQEHQTTAGDRLGWQSSALFRAREGRPNGVEWLHVHETYLPRPDDG